MKNNKKQTVREIFELTEKSKLSLERIIKLVNTNDGFPKARKVREISVEKKREILNDLDRDFKTVFISSDKSYQVLVDDQEFISRNVLIIGKDDQFIYNFWDIQLSKSYMFPKIVSQMLGSLALRGFFCTKKNKSIDFSVK